MEKILLTPSKIVLLIAMLIQSSFSFSMSSLDYAKAKNDFYKTNTRLSDNLNTVSSYFDVDATLTQVEATCANNGSITAVATGATSSPSLYVFKITNGPTANGQVYPFADQFDASTFTFNDLYPGVYQVTIEDAGDACGDFQTRNYTVNATSSSTVILFDERVNRISCTEAVYSVRASGSSSSSYTFEVLGGAPAGYPSTNTTGSFTLPIDQAPYSIRVVGSCGQSDTENINNASSNVFFGVSNKTCTDFDLRLNPNDWMVGPFTFTLTSVPLGYVGPLTNTTGNFDDMPYGDYDYSVTDSCGTTITGSGSAETEVVDITSVLVEADSCSEDLGRVSVFYNSGEAVGPVTIELTTVPAGFSGNAGPRTGNVFSNLVVGSYVATATDACGNEDDFPFEFREEDTLNVDFNITVNQGCINAHSVDVLVNTNAGVIGPKWFNLIDAATGNRESFTASFSGPATFDNVPAGEYYIEYDIFAGCSINSDVFTVEIYQQPRLSPLSSYLCTNSAFVTVSGITEGGVGPFTYSLINNANNQVIATNNECYFTNLDASLNYRVRIEDSCGNTSSAQVTPIAVGLGLEFEGDTCAPIGDPFSIYLRAYTGVDYNWTFPNGSTFNGSDPRATIGTITNSDYGLYTIVATTFDGCRSQTLSLDFNDCPPPSIDFDGVDDYISAPSTFSLGDMQELTIQFWVKANSANQVLAGIVGQRGVFEVTKDASLGYNFLGQGAAGSYSKSAWLDDADTWQHVSIVYNSGEIKTYYKMGTTFTADDRVIDYSGNENHGTVFNIRTWQEETAPMPYVTSQDGNWDAASTWLHGDVWDVPSGPLFSNVGSATAEGEVLTTSSIVKISHDITLNHNKEGVTQIGLIIDDGNTLAVAGDKCIVNRLYTFRNGLTYWDWESILPTTAITPGIGYTQKGTGTAAPEQQYVFEGKPNNGTILVTVEDVGGSGSVAGTSKTEFLLGNPYPSALDVHKFIDDNQGVIDGALQLWQQWSGTSHNLDEYDGGYAQINKVGAVRASQFIGLLGETVEDSRGVRGKKVPTQYLPVGQGFIVEIVSNGNVEFNNSQRIFIKESNANGSYHNGSVFLKSQDKKGKSEASRPSASNAMQKIRLEFNSVRGPETSRELLLAFSEATTDGYDYGYDAETHDLTNNDLSLILEDKNMNIQAYGEITSEKVVPLSFRSSGDNTFEIRASEFENIAKDQDVFLIDNFTGVYFNLKEDTPYRFSAGQGIFNERFQIVFQGEQKRLSAESETLTENHVYYKSSVNTLFIKKLNSDVSKLSLVNMRGQIIMEMTDVSRTQLEDGLELPNMSTGTYIVVFRTDANKIVSKKIIKP